jgi:hypothetical protein
MELGLMHPADDPKKEQSFESNLGPGYYFNIPNRLGFHNLCTILKPPPGTGLLLGLRTKFCIETGQPPRSCIDTLQKFRKDVRLRHWLDNTITMNASLETDEAYIPKIYVNSDWAPPMIDQGNTELQMMDFSNQITSLSDAFAKRPRRFNLTFHQYEILRNLQKDTRFKVCICDKNLGFAMMERTVYMNRAYQDHLSKPDTYQRLSSNIAHSRVQQQLRSIKQFVALHNKELSKAENVFFDRSRQGEKRIPQFYLTMKVHKVPWSTRPIISCMNSNLEALSKWLDYKMNDLLPLAPAYLRDSKQFIDELSTIQLPPNARLFTADAVSMYTNIETTHAINAFRVLLATNAPKGFPTKMFLTALHMVMTTNIFQFDDTFWVQKTGAAMGTLCACLYAT